jgi:predicted ATPase/class 3 adenylate cyclase
MGRGLPSGTVSFVLTDVVGSTRLWQQAPEAMDRVIVRHAEIIAGAVASHGGTLLKGRGEGDSTFSVFARARDAVGAALDAQISLRGERWSDGLSLAVRVAVHTGEAVERDGDYFGPVVNRAARLRSIAAGGDVVVSETTAALVAEALPGAARLVELGDVLLRDLDRPERVFALAADGLEPSKSRLASGAAPTRGAPLSVPLTPLVGREQELSYVLALMSDHRLVTLTGVGGSGKTRLGLAAGAQLAGGVEVCFCDLTSISASNSVARTVARATGVPVRPQGGTDGSDELVRQLVPRQLMLLLDNCEQLLDACAALVGRLVAECPDVGVLATSREPLGVPGEQVFPVPPLPTPADDWDVGAAAVTLFEQRAVEVHPGFSLVDENRPAVLEICRRLDGLPLALELAAARMSHLSAPELLKRLDRRFELLRSRQSGRPRRQRTLAATIDWSYELLSEPARRLLRCLAVFAGRFSLEAVEAACTAGARLDAVDVLGDLVDKSLVVAEHQGPQTTYRLLETIRLYAADRLAGSNDEEPVRQAHCHWFLSRLESIPWDQRLLNAQTAERLEDDYEDYLRAMEWAASSGRDELVARFVASLAGMMATRGHFDDFDRWFPTAQAYESLRRPRERVAIVLGAFVYINRWDGDLDGLKVHRDRLAALIEDFPPGDVITAAGYAILASLSSRLVGERSAMERYADLARAHVPRNAENTWSMAQCQKARALLFRGQHDDAVSLLEGAVDSVGDAGGTTFSTRADLALACHVAGQNERALTIAESRLGYGPPLFTRIDAIIASLAAAAIGDLERGRTHLRFAIDLPTTYQHPFLVNDLRLACGAIAFLDGRETTAAQFLAGLRASSVSTNSLAVLLEHYQHQAGLLVGAKDLPRFPNAAEQTRDWWPEILEEARRT